MCLRRRPDTSPFSPNDLTGAFIHPELRDNARRLEATRARQCPWPASTAPQVAPVQEFPIDGASAWPSTVLRYVA